MGKLALIIVAAVLAIASAVALAGGGIAGASGTLWVTERSANTVTAFDAATGTVLGQTAVGRLPIGITQPSGTDKVYSSDETDDRMSVIDRETVTVIGTIPMGPRPHHLMASPNGKLVYVGEFGHNQIGVVDTDSDARVAGFVASPLANARTHAVWITRDGKDLYATNSRAIRTEPGDIAKLDARSGNLLYNFPIGIDPSEILLTPNGKTAYVSVRGEDRIKVLDVSGELPVLVGEAEARFQPDTLSLTNDGKTLVVGLRGVPARMALIDTGSLTTRYVDLPGATTGHQWLSANGRYTFMAVESPGAVAVVDNDAAELVTAYPYPGGPRPHGVFYEPSVLR